MASKAWPPFFVGRSRLRPPPIRELAAAVASRMFLRRKSLVGNPIPAISNDGWKAFFTEDIFPLSFTQSTARWTPNYSLHLIGGGMTYTSLREWFEELRRAGTARPVGYDADAGRVRQRIARKIGHRRVQHGLHRRHPLLRHWRNHPVHFDWPPEWPFDRARDPRPVRRRRPHGGGKSPAPGWRNHAELPPVQRCVRALTGMQMKVCSSGLTRGRG